MGEAKGHVNSDGSRCMPLKALAAKCLRLWPRSPSLIYPRRFSFGQPVHVMGRYHTAPRKIQDDYDVRDPIVGSGSEGVIRSATAKAGSGSCDSQSFAVKQIELGGLSAEAKRQLTREVAIFLECDHPHIARLFDIYDSDGSLQLVMEFMEGGELYDRVETQLVFSEAEAADAASQMLLAVNYLHNHDMVHRDLKLENFMYDAKDSTYLKMIDFGFSKALKPNVKMKDALGTLPYSAPEVLNGSYNSKCDLWSLGIIVYVLLSGHFPFPSSGVAQREYIREGRISWQPEAWRRVSPGGTDFVRCLLRMDPECRLSAQAALEHPWILQKGLQHTKLKVDNLVVDALRTFSRASRFRRCCMEIMAWSLSSQERARAFRYFLAMDQNRRGTIEIGELRKALQEKFSVPDDETKMIFDVLDFDHDAEVRYSDFLAAMLNSTIDISDHLLVSTFKRFDSSGSGFITADGLREVLGGDVFDGEKVEKLIKEADRSHHGHITYPEFVEYLRGDPLADDAKTDLTTVKGSVLVPGTEAVRA